MGMVILFALLGSVGAIAGAALLLAFPEAVQRRLLPCLLSYATGTLLGAAFLGMIPRSLASLPPSTAGAAVLGGIVVFFVLEKLVLWRHCHDESCDAHGGGALILMGDALHNLVDGVMIASAFLTSVPLGVTASLAVIAHEVPQEVGDFAILLDSGYGRARAFGLNLLSSLATLPGAVAGWLWLDGVREAIPYVLAISAASFVYIAIADLVPRLHQRVGPAALLGQGSLMLLGIATIAAFVFGT